MIITCIVVMVSEMYAQLQVYPDVHIKYSYVCVPSPSHISYTSTMLSFKKKYTS